jgi:hypothetical protein
VSGEDAVTNVVSYRFRLSLASTEVTYELTDTMLYWANRTHSIALADVQSMRTYDVPGLSQAGAPAFARCVIRRANGRVIVINSNSFVSFGNFEDRSESFERFVDALIPRIAAANPQTQFLCGMPPLLWWFWIAILVAVVLVGPMAGLLLIVNMVSNRSFPPALLFTTGLLLGILFQIFTFVRTLRRNRPHRYDPRALQGHA